MQKSKRACARDVARCLVPDVSQPVTASFIIETIAAIFVLVAAGIFAVKKGKKGKEI